MSIQLKPCSLAPCYYKLEKLRSPKFEMLRDLFDMKLLTIKRSECENMIKNIEFSCYEKTITVADKWNIHTNWDNNEFVELYHQMCFNTASLLSCELNGNRAKELQKKIISGEIETSCVGFISCEEFFPELYEKHREKFNQVTNISTNIKTSELYTCYRCKRNQTVVEKNPCRAADEQIPLRITCVFCGNKWSG